MEHNVSYTHKAQSEEAFSHEKVILDHFRDEVSGVIDYYKLHETHEHINPALSVNFAEMSRDEFSHAYVLKQSLVDLKLWHKVPQDLLDMWEEACEIVGFSTNL